MLLAFVFIHHRCVTHLYGLLFMHQDLTLLSLSSQRGTVLSYISKHCIFHIIVKSFPNNPINPTNPGSDKSFSTRVRRNDA